MTIKSQIFEDNVIYELFEEPELTEESKEKKLFNKEDFIKRDSGAISESELVDTYKNDLKVNLSIFMKYLWEQPKAVIYILKNVDNEQEKKNLAEFFINNFYENTLFPQNIEEDLLYVLTSLLKDEINDLKNINEEEKFLNDTCCGYLLEELRKKSDIQSFFKTIILDALENLQVNYSKYLFNFELLKMSKQSKTNEKGSNNINDMDNYNKNEFDFKKRSEQLKNFNKKYMPNLEKKFIEKILKENEKNKRISDYFQSKLNDLLFNEDYYSNKQFEKNFNACKNSEKILYLDYFNASISFINSIIDKILDNSHLIPYSIKCFCLIISKLISIKFSNINEIEKNVFIAKFFFGKLLIPILMNPESEVIINNFIISKNTLYNLKIICDIINKFLSGQFYINKKNSDYTPFNWYFIEKLEKLFNIFDNLTKVKIPSFIEEFKLPLDYQYDYFKQKPDEIIHHRAVCFNKEQLDILANTMNILFKDEIFKDVGTKQKNDDLKDILSKLLPKGTEKLLNRVVKINKKENGEVKETEKTQKPKKKEVKEKKKQKDIKIQKKHYFLITEFLTNEKYKDLLISEEEMNDFLIKEEKDLNEEKNVIKKIKNLLGVLLNNYNKLVITDFVRSEIGNTKDILNQLDILMKSSNYVIDQSVPLHWFKDSLLEYLQKVPLHLSENDFNKLYDEIENEINNSIKQYDFDIFSVYNEKLESCEKKKNYYSDIANHLKDIKINYETKKIIDEEIILVEIEFFLNEEANNFNGNEDKNEDNNEDKNEDKNKDKNKDKNNKKKMEINTDQKNDKMNIGEFKITEKDKKEIKKYERKKGKEYRELCSTIDDFTNKFPNLIVYEEEYNLDILLIQEKLEFQKKLESYFEIVQKVLNNKGIKELPLIEDKIYDYVMSKIYNKIFPFESSKEDMEIFQKLIKLSWTEPKHFIKYKNKEIMFGNFFEKIKSFINLIVTEKSINKKFSNLIKIFDSMQSLFTLNKIGETGVDDEISVITYLLIKSPQINLFSNIIFMNLYIRPKDKTSDISQKFNELRAACTFIVESKWDSLNNVTEEEYNNNCEKACSKSDI